MVAELAVAVGMLPSETQAMEARHTSRLQLVENEVVIFQGKIKDKDANGGCDLFPVKIGFLEWTEKLTKMLEHEEWMRGS